MGYMRLEKSQSCLTLCNPRNCSLPGSSVHRLFQARILDWVAIFFPVYYVFLFSLSVLFDSL